MAIRHVTPDNLKETTSDLSPLFSGAARLAAGIRVGTAMVTLPNGITLKFGGIEPGPHGAIVLHNDGLAKKTLQRGAIGVAESYLAGEWSTDNLTDFLEVFCHNPNLINDMMKGKPLLRAYLNFRHWMNRNSRKGSERNIYAHYDLGNQFYEKWLDPSMTYSSAIFEEPEADLTAAQTAKFGALANQIHLEPDNQVLEIGCGWGGFAEYAAKERGANVTGITISREQFDYAKKRIFDAGLNEKVEIRLQDYRDTTGGFDRIASIEMFEAVGEKYWPTFFDTVAERLKPGGRAGMQVITIQDSMFDDYRKNPDFIQKYVFPGGMLPSPSVLRSVAERSGLRFDAERIFGHDYARTLADWRDRFRGAWPEIVPLGFDERFRRLWEFYLAYCEAGFRARNIDVRQVVFSRP
ncbi:MAG: cyclopropane-fatty-acyl-phospholipid synthase family protein [Pseudomonadota bacterium]